MALVSNPWLGTSDMMWDSTSMATQIKKKNLHRFASPLEDNYHKSK